MAQADPEFFFSILVRTFDSEKSLQALLPALKLQPGDEIVVVDSGSKDRTISIAENHGARIFHAPPPFNYSKSLNIGFSAAKNPWVHVLSSHSIPMVGDLLRTFREVALTMPEDVVVAYGPSTLTGGGFPAWREVRYFDRTNLADAMHHCGNANTLYRRAAWVEMPFDEEIRTGEDRAWLALMAERGYSLCLVPAARTMNRSRYSLGYMFRKGFSDSRAGVEKPMSVLSLFMGIGSRARQSLGGSMPWGNLLRSIAQHTGAFFGSYQTRDNTPTQP